MTSPLSIHPLAAKMPEMSPEEYEELKADVARNGLLNPIVLYGKSQVLDGRHRLKACRETGTEIKTREYKGCSPATFVISSNLKRRNLTQSQRAFIALDYAEELKDEAASRKAAANCSEEIDEAKGRAIDLAAEFVGVSPRLAYDAQEVRKHAPQEEEKIRAGKKTVSAAKAELTKAAKPEEEEDPVSKMLSVAAETAKAKRVAGKVLLELKPNIEVGNTERLLLIKSKPIRLVIGYSAFELNAEQVQQLVKALGA